MPTAARQRQYRYARPRLAPRAADVCPPAARSPDLKLEWSLDGQRATGPRAVLLPERGHARAVAARPHSVDDLERPGRGVLVDRRRWCTWIGGAGARPGAPSIGCPLGAGSASCSAAWLLAVFWSATVPRLDRVDKLTLLGGGQDWLTHEALRAGHPDRRSADDAREATWGGADILRPAVLPVRAGGTARADWRGPVRCAGTAGARIGRGGRAALLSGEATVRRLGRHRDVLAVPAVLELAPGVGGVPADLRGDLLRDSAGLAAGAGPLPG